MNFLNPCETYDIVHTKYQLRSPPILASYNFHPMTGITYGKLESKMPMQIEWSLRKETCCHIMERQVGWSCLSAVSFRMEFSAQPQGPARLMICRSPFAFVYALVSRKSRMEVLLATIAAISPPTFAEKRISWMC